jgi:ribosomal protein RSM22 (predicted rRNA methylase)
MAKTGQMGSWTSDSYVAEWLGSDVMKDMLMLPRRITAALVADDGVAVSHVLDLGAGDGIYLEVLLDAFPDARGTWLDPSEAMRDAARGRLARFDGRVEYVIGDAERLGELEVEPSEVIVTSRVVHHFPADSIQTLYRTALGLLSPGGFFFNLDHYGTPGDWEQRYRRIRPAFLGKNRARPHRHDFPLIDVGDHLRWLGEAGFESTDTPWRTFFTSLVAARRAGPGQPAS